jgi:thioredoxin reductase
MPTVIIIGDGPGGASAALFLAKNKVDVVVFGDDKSAMHYAYLKNYLGIPAIMGAEFQRVAREQITAVGARVRDERVSAVSGGAGRFEVKTEAGDTLTAKYLILSEGKGPRLAKTLGLQFDENKGIATDRNAHTSVEGVYVVGRSARPGRSQAIISAGDGASAAIDILSREAGHDVLDWDEPAKS